MAFEFPYSFVSGGVARASEVMANFNKIKKEFDEGITSIKAGAVTASMLAANAVGHGQLAAGYGFKMASGTVAVSVPEGHQTGASGNFAHNLGAVPTGGAFIFESGENLACTFEARLLAWDTTNIQWQMILSTPLPFLYSGTAYWTLWTNA